MERELKRVKNARLFLIAASEDTLGHGTVFCKMRDCFSPWVPVQALYRSWLARSCGAPVSAMPSRKLTQGPGTLSTSRCPSGRGRPDPACWSLKDGSEGDH